MEAIKINLGDRWLTISMTEEQPKADRQGEIDELRGENYILKKENEELTKLLGISNKVDAAIAELRQREDANEVLDQFFKEHENRREEDVVEQYNRAYAKHRDRVRAHKEIVTEKAKSEPEEVTREGSCKIRFALKDRQPLTQICANCGSEFTPKRKFLERCPTCQKKHINEQMEAYALRRAEKKATRKRKSPPASKATPAPPEGNPTPIEGPYSSF